MKKYLFLFLVLSANSMFSQDITDIGLETIDLTIEEKKEIVQGKFVFVEMYEEDGNKGFRAIKVVSNSTFEKKVWLKDITPAKKYKSKNGKWIDKSEEVLLTLLEMDCSESSFRLLEQHRYSIDGKLIKSIKLSGEDNSIIPGTTTDLISKIACD